ncbi:MAG: cobyric acid synthase [Victivallales bacterium]|nr:cobyric acid synthase [Victivallales bacterium]
MLNTGHGGNLNSLAELAGCTSGEILDFSSNINPLGPPEFLRAAVSRALDNIVHYPDPAAERLIAAAAEVYGATEQNIVAGNGSEQLIYAIPRAFGLKKALIAVPAYIDYEKSCRLAGLEVNYAYLDETDDFAPVSAKLDKLVEADTLVFIGHPGNPAGTAMPKEDLLKLAKKHPEAVFVIDEAFADFCGGKFSVLPDIPPNMVILRSLTKFYAIPGLRLGLAFASESNAALIRAQLPPWSVNTIAQETGIKILTGSEEYARETRTKVDELRRDFSGRLAKLGLKVFPGLANYLLLKLPAEQPEIYDKLLDKLLKEYHIAVRNCADFSGLSSRFFRVAVKNQDDNAHFIAALRQVLEGGSPVNGFYFRRERKTPSLMLQGTCSNAGKSVLSAAFCRILLQDSYRVAPFKSQNMALNSHVTADGGEIGRAQAVQAQACRLAPDVRMNPVLLKPSTDTGSQVIVMGKATGNMEAKKYFSRKRDLFPLVQQAYDSLAAEYDAIILEGAGSPGEVNLKKHDIVNMNMARYAQSPVLLAGDIDRGGVYAAFIGTMETFLPWERELLKGFLVNKFRGDATLLRDAHEYVENFTGRPVLGVIPYKADLGIPEEDSVSFALTRPAEKFSVTLDAALIELPHISNFTDFTPLEIEPDLNIRKIRHLRDLGNPDVIILPGSKNVIGDLKSLRECGIAQAIIEKVKTGAWLVGICGGLQMTGALIRDPLHLESQQPEVNGLDLLPLTTVLEKDKCLNQTQAVIRASGDKVSGYEIHHGKTVYASERLVSMRSNTGEAVGFAAGRIWLTYLHGVFDEDVFRRKFIDMIRVERGLKPLEKIQISYDIDAALDRLADLVRENVAMDKIYRIMGLK